MKDVSRKLIIGIIITIVIIIGFGILLIKNKTYTITFLSNGINNTIKVKSGATIKKIVPENKEGFIFSGWYLNGELYDFSKPVEDNITLEARWIISDQVDSNEDTCIISFDSDGGTLIDSKSIICGNIISNDEIGVPLKNGYTFKEWQLNDKTYNFNEAITSNITLKAKWEKIEIVKYTISFDSNGGSNVSSQIVNAGEKGQAPSTPTRIGYAFIEWQLDGKAYNFSKAITNNITLKAVWKEVDANKFIVSFDSNGGSIISTQIVKSGNTVAKPTNPVRDGYTFKEWQLNSQKYDFNNKIISNITLVCSWTPTIYSISYNLNGGTANNPTSYTIESNKIILINPTRTGYTFTGWTGSNGNTPQVSVTIPVGSKGNKNYIANWKINEYTVSFNSNGGTSIASQRVEYGKTAAKPNNPTKTGYTFVRWYTNAGKLFNFDKGIITSDTQLNALWIKLYEPSADGIKMNGNKYLLFQIDPSSYKLSTIKSSNSKVADVSIEGPNGYIIPKSYGTTTITILNNNIKYKEFNINVIPNVNKIDFNNYSFNTFYSNMTFNKSPECDYVDGRNKGQPGFQEFDFVVNNGNITQFYFSSACNALENITSLNNTITTAKNMELRTSVICKTKASNVSSNSLVPCDDYMYLKGAGQGQTFIKEPSGEYFWTSSNTKVVISGSNSSFVNNQNNACNSNIDENCNYICTNVVDSNNAECKSLCDSNNMDNNCTCYQCTWWGGNNANVTRYSFAANNYNDNITNTRTHNYGSIKSNKNIYSFIAADWDNNLIAVESKSDKTKVVVKVYDANDFINKVDADLTPLFEFNVSNVIKLKNGTETASVSRQGIAISGGYYYRYRGNWNTGLFIEQYNMNGTRIGLINVTDLTGFAEKREEGQGMTIHNNTLYFGSVHRPKITCVTEQNIELSKSCSGTNMSSKYNIYSISNK